MRRLPQLIAFAVLAGLVGCSAPPLSPTISRAPSTTDPTPTSSPSARDVEPALRDVTLVRTSGEVWLVHDVGIFGDREQLAPATPLIRFAEDDPERDLVLPLIGPGARPGWVSADDGETLVPLALTCPDAEPSVPVLAGLGDLAALCLGGRDFTFEAFVPGMCGIADGPLVSGDPDWLTGHAPGVVLYGERVDPNLAAEPPPSGYVGAVTVPGVELANCDERLAGRFHRLTAHYDDPASASCRTQWTEGAGIIQETPAVTIARCRLTLVITAVEG